MAATRPPRPGAGIGAAALAAALLLAGPSAAVDIVLPDYAKVGEPLRGFSLPDTSGKTVRLEDFRGKVVMLSFWSCYTDTCFTTVKVFDDLVARLGPKGLAAPTVCEEIPPALAADNYAGLLERCSRGQVILIDKDREVRGMLRIHQLPTTIVLDRDLVVREIVRGVTGLRDPALHERIEKLVGAAPAAAPSP